MKKTKIILVALLCAVGLAAGAYVANKIGLIRITGPILGELSVLSHSPEGPEIPISTDGITVMFDKAVVPLTTLDKGREKSIPLKITPHIDGKFFWLGTHGFIFRPQGLLDPATTYQVELPSGIVSVDGYRLSKPLKWEFKTVAPRILNWSPADKQPLLPKSASIFLRFNLAMDQSDVEKKLNVADSATGQLLLAKRDYSWGDGGHTLRVQFKEELPWESEFKVTLPQGTRAKTGDIGTTEPVTVTYTTPAKKMEIEKVGSYDMNVDEEIVLKPGVETPLTAGSGLCYYFSQSITKKSFEKAFHVEPVADNKPPVKKPQPYFYFGDREVFDGIKDNGKVSEIEGYKSGCASFLDDYDRTYRFSIDPKQIESLSGAPLETGGDAYIAKTNHATPEMHSLLTKNILSHRGPLKIPYRGMNLKSATLRIYRWNDKSTYDEGVKNESLFVNDQETKTPLPMANLGMTRASLPVDPATADSSATIDQKRMPADLVQEVPMEMKTDVSTHFQVDLASLATAVAPASAVSPITQDGRLVPGLYLIEVIGRPAVDVKRKKKTEESTIAPRAVFSLIQVTPVGIALKREAEHVLAWATDLETGSPLSGLPINLTLEKWNSSLGVSERQNETNIITNGEGVAVWPVASTDDVHVCAQVTQPGSESFSCEQQHRISEYRWGMKPGPHYFAYLYTDRPIYRPGQKVFFSSFIREVREGRYFMMHPGTPVKVRITDADGQEAYKKDDAALGAGGVVSGEFQIEDGDDVPRGEYHLEMTVDKQKFNKSFRVTSYRKPSFKVDLKTDTPEIISGHPLQVGVQGSYFFGAPLRKSKASWSIMTSTYAFSPEGYTDYSFIDDDLLNRKVDEDGEGEYAASTDYDYVATSWEPESAEGSDQYDDPTAGQADHHGGAFFLDPKNAKMSFQPGLLDEQGLLKIQYKPNLKKYITSQILTVEANVQDPSLQEVSGSEDIIVHKAEFYLGVKPEKWVYGDKEAAKMKVVSLDTKGKPTPKVSYKMDVVRREYKFIERRTANGFWDFVFEPQDTKMTTLSGKTGANGEDEQSYNLPQGGTYRFVVKGEDGVGNEVQAANEVYAWGSGYVPWRLDKPETVELVPDKDSYKVGDTAKILVKSLVPVTKALMTLERGHVLEYKIIDLGGNASHIEIPITEGMIPNLYLNVVAHVGRSPDAAAANAHPPLLYYGETELHVQPESKRMNITVTADRKGEGDQPPIYRPGDEVKVHVHTADPSGKAIPAHVMISVADESVLRLLNYQLPDLVKKFYYRRPNGVVTSSSLLSLKAGDSGKGGTGKRRLFKDTAHFEAHLVTNGQGDGDISFKLPDDLTTWVIEALAISESKTSESFEAERQQALSSTTAGQKLLGTNLTLTDNTFVGGVRGKIMSTLPLVLRPALPRFAVWGDSLQARVIANNRNPQPVDGQLTVAVSGDAALKDGQAQQVIDFSIPANQEKTFPVDVSIKSASAGRMTFSAEAKNAQGTVLDGLEVSLPVRDRFAPEVVATSGTTQSEEKEKIELPTEIVTEKGDLNVTLKPSIAFAAAPSLRNLIYFPWGCSEQKSATLLALLMARDLTLRFGETYFDTLAPISEEAIKSAKGIDEKKKILDQKIQDISDELILKYQNQDGGMKYWPESQLASFYPSVQVLAALTKAQEQGFNVDATAKDNLKKFVRGEILREDHPLSPDNKAYGFWGLTLDHSWEMDMVADTLIRQAGVMSVNGLSYLLMAVKNGNSTLDATPVSGRLLSIAKQDPRHVSWDQSDFFWSSASKNTALAALALLTQRQDDPNVPRALNFLLNRKKVAPCQCTQDNLYVSWLIAEYTKYAKEDQTHYKAAVTAAGKPLASATFAKDNLLAVNETKVALKEVADLKSPIDVNFSKNGDGTLYYDMTLKYYLPPEKTPTREEGLIVSREYYALDDVKEEKPLTEFKAGETYKGHIVLVAPSDLNYTVVQDLLPSGFEPVDMSLAITSQAANLASQEGGGSQTPAAEYESEWDDGSAGYYSYDDVIVPADYGMSYGFIHQEIRDDAVVWSDEVLPAGVYHIRYPVRATTPGTFLMPGASAFEFYEPEIFGRSRSRLIKISEPSK